MRIIGILLLLLALAVYLVRHPATQATTPAAEAPVAFVPPYASLPGVLSASRDQIMALAGDGIPWAWGINDKLQLGLPERRVYNMPESVPVSAPFQRIFQGDDISYGLDGGGQLWRLAAAANSYPPPASNGFTSVFAGERWKKVESRWNMGVGLSSTGELSAWNEEDFSAANPPDRHHIVPAQPWQDFCVGQGNMLAVASDGSLWRSLTPSTAFTNILAPVNPGEPAPDSISLQQIPASTRFQHVYCRDNTGQVLALDENFQLWGYGHDQFGELGDGGNAPDVRYQDIKRVNGEHWLDVAVAPGFTLAIRGDGSLWSWGNNSSGNLGTGDNDSHNTPALIDQQHRWLAVAASHGSGVALSSEGQLYAWGNNGAGLLGDGGVAERRNRPGLINSNTLWKK
jgi:alpha-tubulin suppressor-like RCC1 family protein